MKPLSSSLQTSRRQPGRRFPVTDWTYQATRVSDFKSSCAGSPRPAFDLISRQYFNAEARHNFVIEAAIFGVVAVTTVPAVIDCARALAMFFRAIGTI